MTSLCHARHRHKLYNTSIVTVNFYHTDLFTVQALFVQSTCKYRYPAIRFARRSVTMTKRVSCIVSQSRKTESWQKRRYPQAYLRQPRHPAIPSHPTASKWSRPLRRCAKKRRPSTRRRNSRHLTFCRHNVEQVRARSRENAISARDFHCFRWFLYTSLWKLHASGRWRQFSLVMDQNLIVK